MTNENDTKTNLDTRLIIRLTADLQNHITTAWIDTMQREGVKMSRSEFIRSLIEKGLCQ